VLLVATPEIEPALGSVAAGSLARLGHAPLLVLNRAQPRGGGADLAAPESERAHAWSARGFHWLPESRMGAQLASGGREARGELGRAIAELADLCERSE
jgi:hypothetical protein